MEKIVILGAGNLAFHLAQRLQDQGLQILQIYSRKITKARRLAKLVQANATKQLTEIDRTAELYIIAVADNAIGEVAQQIALQLPQTTLVVHTSGATPSTVLRPHFKRYGIFYPLQSFSIARPVDFEQLPICIDAKTKRDQKLLVNLATRICPNVHLINDEQRAVLHVAAVFVNNFTNHLFDIGQQIVAEQSIDFALLKPLIAETAAKVQDNLPTKMQTGPAVRNDQKTIARHLAYLEKFPAYAAIYQLLSQSILSGKG